MFSNLLVTLDGNDESERILPLAASVAHATGAEVYLLRVVDEHAAFEEMDTAIRYLASVNTRLMKDGVKVHTNVARGHVSKQILDEAQRIHAEVILMTTRGRGGLTRALLGSVTEQVFNHSQVPVMALRFGGVASDAIRKILVPMDDSLGSALALSAAKFLSGSASSRIELLRVVEPLVRYFRGRYIEPEWDEATRVRAETDMEALAASLQRIGFEAHGQAVIGQVAPSIVATANQVGADLIVMTTNGHTGVARALLGSIADEVLRTADVPVLLLHFNLEQGLAALRQSASEAVKTTTGPSSAPQDPRGESG